MILDRITKLEAVLAGSVSANQPEVAVDYIDWNPAGQSTSPAQIRSALNGASDVTILDTPATKTNNQSREPIRVDIYNKDTASVTVTVKTDDGTTERILIKATLLTLESLHWERASGWYAMDANGNRKEATSSVFSSITVTTSSSFPSGSWTPADGSGAGLSLSNISANYTMIGRLVFAYANFTYPSTADGTSAAISGFPFASANAAYSRQGILSFTTSGTATKILMSQNDTVASFRTNSGAAVTNAQMSTSNNFVLLIYPTA